MFIGAFALALGQAHGQDIVVDSGSSASNGVPTTYNSILVRGTDSLGTPSTYSADAGLTVTNRLSVYWNGVFSANADVSAGSVDVFSDGRLNLNSGTFSTPSLSLSGSSAVAQNGGRYAVDYLYLGSTPALSYGVGDSITTSVTVDNSSLTLGRNLSISDRLYLDHGGTVVRTGAESITAGSFDVRTDSTLTVRAGDSFAGYNYVNSGGQVSNTGTTSYFYLNVSGTDSLGAPSTYSADAGLAVTNYLSVSSDGVFNANADVFANFVLISGGTLNLNSGTFSTSTLYAYGSSAVAQNGGHYAVDSLSLSSTAAVTYGVGDSITTNVSVGDDAVLTLGKDLVIAGDLNLAGSGGLVTGGHNYAVSSLYLTSAATLTYGVGDSITTNVTVDNASLTLGRDLSISDRLYLDHGGTVIRTGAESITAGSFDVRTGSALTVRAGDSFAGYNYVISGGQVSNTGTTSYFYLNVSGTDSLGAPSTYSADAGLAVTNNLIVSSDGVFNANADVSANNYVLISGGTLNLNSGTFSTSTLYAYGSSAVAQNGGHYAVDSLSLSSTAALTYGVGDSITTNVSVGNDAVLTLGKDLVIAGDLNLAGSGGLVTGGHNYAVSGLYLTSTAAFTYGVGDSITTNVTVDNSSLTLGRDLSISGRLYLDHGGTVIRTGSESITAGSFDVRTGSALNVRAGDSFAGYNYVNSGGQVSNTGTTSYFYLNVSGTDSLGAPSTYSADAGLAVTAQLYVSSGGVFNANADVSVSSYVVADHGRLNLNSGTLSTPWFYVSGSSAVAQNGGHYAVDYLYLSSTAALTYGVGDSITTTLDISGTGSLLTANTPLSLQSLSLTSGGSLLLANFSGVWSGQPYAMRLNGDATTQLQGYQSSNQLLYSVSASEVSIVYDAVSNATYIIPEPSTYAMAFAGLACGGYSLIRRRKRA